MRGYDQKLRDAMREIEGVLKKYDIGGFVTLQSRSHAEFKFLIETPSWSNVRYVKEGAAIHLKIHNKSKPKETEATVGMLYSIRDLCAMGFQQMDVLANRIEQQVKVIHTTFGGGINNDDRE